MKASIKSAYEKIAGLCTGYLRWLHNAPFAVRTLFVALVFAAPVVVLALSVTRDYAEEHDFTVGELEGVRLLESFGPLNKALLEARATARAQAAGFDTGAAFKTEGLRDGSLFSGMQRSLETSTINASPRLAGSLVGLKGRWTAAAQSEAGLTTDGQRTVFGAVTESGIALQQEIGDASGIILDPRIDTLYLGLVVLQVMPALLQNLEQLWSWSTYLAAKGDSITYSEINQARQRYATWDANVQEQLKAYRADINKVVDYNATVKSQIDLVFLDQVEHFRAKAFDVAMENATADTQGIWLEGGQAFDKTYAAYDAILPVLADLLQTRQRNLEAKYLELALSSCALLLLTAYAFNSFYRSIVKNIAAQQRTEADLRQGKQRAEDVAVVKSQFLANMSHEIRTPMNAILGMLTLLHGTDLTPRQLDYASKSEGAARSLLGLINDILDFSKIEAGKMELEVAPFKLDRLLRDLSVILSVSVGAKPVEVLFDVDPQTPPVLVGDALRLQQILVNLCSNAIKFTAKGEVVVSIQLLDCAADACELRFAVKDSGIGIAQDKQQFIFTGFSQAEASTTRRFGGTGLGLSISRQLVALMGGDLALNSVLGTGSTFHFTISLALAKPAAPAPEHAAKPKLGALNVLVVDDNALARNLLTAMAQSLGWRADAVADGTQAVALVDSMDATGKQAFEAIFIDWEMPGLDGWETIARIRKAGNGLAVPITVMVTSHSREALSQRSVQEQAQLSAFLVKPITAAMMLEAVADAKAGHSRLRSQKRSQHQDAGGRLQGMHLLVVEDNPINQQVAQELLVSEGAVVSIADNGLLGVAAVAEATIPFHAVLMDVQMPVMDGYAATRAIRHDLKLPDLPVIAMTANAMAGDREACLEAGMNDHVGKPFDLAHLVAVLLEHTGFHAPVIPTNELLPLADLNSIPAGPSAPPTGTLIDTQAALQRLGGMKSLYVRLAREFHTDLQATVPEYRRLIAASLLTDAVRHMHTLKGTAATLGAMQLSEFARALEVRCKDPSKGVLEDPQVDQLQAAVDATRQALDRVIAELGEAPASTVAPPPETLHKAPASAPQARTLHAILKELESLLAQSDLQALDRFAKFRLQLETQEFAQFPALEQALQDLDLSAALVACRAMAAQLDCVDA